MSCATGTNELLGGGVVDDRINEAGMRTAAPGRSAMLYSAVKLSRAKVLFATLLPQNPSLGQQATSRMRRVMSAFCVVTQSVGGTLASFPKLLRGIWAWSTGAGFRGSRFGIFQQILIY